MAPIEHRALFVTPNVPGRGTGGCAVTLSFLQALRRTGWRVHGVLCPGPEAVVDELARSACDETTVVRKIGRARTPLGAGLWCALRHGYWPRYHDPLRAEVLALLDSARYDLLVLDGMGVAEVGRFARRAGLRLPIAFREHNVEAALVARSLALLPNWRLRSEASARLRRYRAIESNLARYCDLVLAVSAVDAAQLRASCPGFPVEPFPPPIDVEHYRPSAVPPRGKELVFVGGFAWPPNVDAMRWFVEEVWPAVRERHPDARLDVVGDDPPPWLRSAPNVTALGFLPDEREVVARARAVVVPVRYGSGVRVKILHSLAMGKAVVSTRIGAEGIAVRDGHSALLGDTPEEFARAVCTALEDDGCVERLGRNGRAVCLESFGAARLDADLDRVLRRLLADRSWPRRGGRRLGRDRCSPLP
jgi:polysaccharide biosynthesis protein PslH